MPQPSAPVWSRRCRVLCLLALCVLCARQSAAEKAVLLATAEWPPYVSQGLAQYGFTSEIVVEAFARAGYRAQIHFMPWERALRKVEEGKYDAVYPAYYAAERAQVYAFSRPFSAGPVGLCKRKTTPIAYRTLRDLQPYTIGVVRGYVNTPEFDAADYFTKDVADSDAQNMQKLLKARVDMIVIDKLTAQFLLNKMLPETRALLECLEPPLAEKVFHVMFSRNVPGYAQRVHDFHQGLQHMTEDGTLKGILHKHGLQ